jgi:hypothetical protein
LYFITRVELSGSPGTAAHEALHEQMRQRGFVKTVNSDAGSSFQLPQGIYVHTGVASLTQVRDWAISALTECGHPGTVVVGDANNVAWYGLTPMSVPSS